VTDRSSIGLKLSKSAKCKPSSHELEFLVSSIQMLMNGSE